CPHRAGGDPDRARARTALRRLVEPAGPRLAPRLVDRGLARRRRARARRDLPRQRDRQPPVDRVAVGDEVLQAPDHRRGQLGRPRTSLLALAAGVGYALYLVGYAVYHAVGSPYEMGVQLYSDALGFAILQQANRYLYWTPSTARWVLLAILAAGSLVLLAARL